MIPDLVRCRTLAWGALLLLCAVTAGAEPPTPTTGPAGQRPLLIDSGGNSLAGQTAAYDSNLPVHDFEAHFLISLPFTALYGFVAVTVVDSMVQQQFPPEFRQADMWLVAGFAVGCSLAIALGSQGRVPAQSQPRGDARNQGTDHGCTVAAGARIDLCRLEF